MRKTTRQTYTNFRSKQPDVSITIIKFGDEHKVEAQILDHHFRFRIPLSVGEIGNISEKLYLALEDAQADALGKRVQDPESVIRRLARVGYDAFNTLFKSSDSETFLDELDIRTSAGGIETVQICSEDFDLPWELLYPESPLSPTFQNFWGFRYSISRWPAVEYEHRPPPSEIHAKVPVVALIINDDYEGVQDQVRKFEAFEANSQVDLRILDSLDVSDRTSGESKFLSFLRISYDVTHFACHGEYNGGDDYRVGVRQNFDISLNRLLKPANPKLRRRDPPWDNHSFIVMNACELGRTSPAHTLHFASLFLSRGARGVVAAQCSVPDEFGAAFMQYLYARVLRAVPFGRALQATRRYFAVKYENPLGLIYALYGPHNVVIVTKEI